MRRRVHVVSSEAGHARDARAWSSLRVSASAQGRDARSSLGQRGIGAPSLDLAVAAARELRARLVRAAAEAAQAALLGRDAWQPPAGWAPAIVLAPGGGGVLVHEAVGHALEADVVARGASHLGGRFGEHVAAEALTVVDDASLTGLAGSYGHDDEGIRPRRTALLERGVLVGLLSDGLRTGFEPQRSSGHGRRASFRDAPLPRMANTCVEPGGDDPEGILAGTADGLFVKRLERAAVDPASGDVHFRVTEATRIEDGRLTCPVAPVGLVGNGSAILWAVDAVGSDFAWDDGTGTCGREGQWLQAAVGQPTVRVGAGVLSVVG
jgi:TldD protein